MIERGIFHACSKLQRSIGETDRTIHTMSCYKSAQSYVRLFVLVITCLTVLSEKSGHHHHGLDKKAVLDKDHLKEHLDGKIETDKQMTDGEMQFHFFKIHDYDNNNMLDGIEIVAAITDHARNDPKVEPFSDKYLEEQIDTILKRDDMNGNGYVEYPEYVIAMRNRQ